jgi:hypothetical protein
LFDIYTGGDLIISRTQKGEIPIISHSMANNGIAEWTVPIKGQNLFNASNTISLADRGNFHAFTQTTDFYIGTRVKALKAKFLNPNKFILLFICTMINKQAVKFSYGNNATGGIGKLKILLPINSEGEPDYAFMEDYMRQKEKELLKQYEKQLLDFEKVVLLSEKEWKPFKLSSIFEIENCKCSNISKLKEGNIPYVGATNRNNGTLKFVEHKEQLITKGNCLVFICDGEGSVGTSIYKKEDFIGSTTVKVGRNSNLNKYIGTFITTIADSVRDKYNFGFKRNETHLKNEILMLPINNKNEPDYLYMENYIKFLEYEKLKRYLEYKQLHTTH